MIHRNSLHNLSLGAIVSTLHSILFNPLPGQGRGGSASDAPAVRRAYVLWRAGLALQLACLCTVTWLGPALQAQTAHFSSAQFTLGSGFNLPYGVGLDGSGNIFLADSGHNAVKKMPQGCASSSCVTALGGGSFHNPEGLAVGGGSKVYVYVADTGSNSVKKLLFNCVHPTCVTALGGGFDAPEGVAVDAGANVYVADTGNSAVKKIPVNCTSSSCVTTLGGGFSHPTGVALDGSGNVFVSDSNNNAVYKIPPGCTQSTCVTTPVSGFSAPADVAVDANGNVYVADTGNGEVKEIPEGCAESSCVTTLREGLNGPQGVAVDVSENVYVSDSNDNLLLELMTTPEFLPTAVASASSTLSFNFTFDEGGAVGAPAVLTQGAANLDFTDAGTGTCTTNGISHAYEVGDTCTVDVIFKPAHPGLRSGGVELTTTSGAVIAMSYVSGTGTGPQIVYSSNNVLTTMGGGIAQPGGMAVDASGNIYVADFAGSAVYKIPVGCVSFSCMISLGGGFNTPTSVAVDGSGNVFATEFYNNGVVQEIPVGCVTSACVISLGGGFNSPYGIAVDGAGNVYVSDSYNNAVKKMPANCTSSSCVTTLGGNFNFPEGLAVDGNGNVYVVDLNNFSVKVMPDNCASAGCVGTVAFFYFPAGVAVDGAGDIFVTSEGNGLVEELPAGCGCRITLATVESPWGVAVDGSGNLFFDWSFAYKVDKLDFSDPPKLSFAPTHVGATSSDSPQTVTVSNDGNEPLILSDLTVPSNFALGTATTCNSSITLNAGQACSLAVEFTPDIPGNPLVGSLVLTDNSLNASPDTTQSISVTGVAAGVSSTSLTVSPSASTYGQTVVLSALVTGAQGGPTPTGMVIFYANGIQLAQSALDSSGTATCSTQTLAIGTYSITASYQGSSIYPVSSSAAEVLTISLGVTTTSLTVSPSTSAYTLPVEFSALVAGAQGGPTPTGMVVFYSNGTQLATVPLNPSGGASYFPAVFLAGNYSITATFEGSATEYGPSTSVTEPLTIKKAVLNVVLGPPLPGAPGIAVGYGQGNSFTLPNNLCQIMQITGFVNGDGPSVVKGSSHPAISWGTNPDPPVGNYTLSCALGTLSAVNYMLNLDTAPETVAVVPAVLTVKPNYHTVKYGSALPALDYSVAGFKYGQMPSILSNSPLMTTTAITGSPVGNYPISVSVSGITAANYSVVAGPPAQLTITPATLQVKAMGTDIKQGAPIPSFTYLLSGLTNGDTSAVVSGTPVITTTAVQGSPAGTYPIVVSVSGMSASNYKITAGPNATLVIKP